MLATLGAVADAVVGFVVLVADRLAAVAAVVLVLVDVELVVEPVFESSELPAQARPAPRRTTATAAAARGIRYFTVDPPFGLEGPVSVLRHQERFSRLSRKSQVFGANCAGRAHRFPNALNHDVYPYLRASCEYGIADSRESSSSSSQRLSPAARYFDRSAPAFLMSDKWAHTEQNLA
jgi:hypothetical protein